MYLYILDNLHIYTNKIDALKVIKEHKTGRLKTFKTYTDAEEYATTGHEQIYNCPNNSFNVGVPVIEEKSSNFKGPKTQDLICFKKLIESGDLDAVKDTIWGNPRYLISSGDTPAILQVHNYFGFIEVSNCYIQTAIYYKCHLFL